MDETILSFEAGSKIIIPFVVALELNKFKKGTELVNEYARTAIRFLDSLRKLGDLNNGVEFQGREIQVTVDEKWLNPNEADIQIIETARTRQLLEPDNQVKLITQDIHERIIADVLGIPAEGYDIDNVNAEKLYTGHRVIDITDDEVQALAVQGEFETNRRLVHNQFVTMRDSVGGKQLGVYDADKKRLALLSSHYEAYGIKPAKDRKTGEIISEQIMLLHLLMDKKVEFVTTIGPSGCGKTLLTLAAAMEQTFVKEIYKKIIIMRPLVAIGNDIGFLPGTKEEKLEEWMGSAFDNLEYLIEEHANKSKEMFVSARDKIYELIDSGKLELEAMTFIRGRSIPNQLIIVDDAQNLTQKQAASIITRAGIGTKVIFCGDISKQQIDDYRLNPNNNGLAYVVDKLKGEDIVGHVTFPQNSVVRSRLAQLGVERL